MKKLYNYNEFLLESIQVPKKRFPTEKVLNIIDVKNHIEKKYSIDFSDLSDNKSGGFHDRNFFTGYESGMLLKTNPDAIVYPEITTLEEIKMNYPKNSPYYDSRYEQYIDDDSIVEIPIRHDSSLDDNIYNQKRQSFFDRMRKLTGKNTSDEDLAKGVNFGPKSFDWANKALDLINKEFSQHYKNGNIKLWHPKGWSEAAWGHTNPDYPHKYYYYSGEVAQNRKDGLYFLSDIENYIDKKYGISDDKFYDWIIANDYIEGRYWENIVHISFETQDGKLSRGGGQYGMKPTENIEHILNILEKDFDLLKEGDGDGFEIYIDYYKKLPSKF